MGYRIEGGEVVFVFEVSKYRNTTKNGTAEIRPLRDLSIDSVFVRGDFNRWYQAGWRMDRVAAGKFELHYPLQRMPGRPPWRFKFFVNDMYWVEPPTEACNVRIDDLPRIGPSASLVLKANSEYGGQDICGS
jgi:hypothetical protein